jgi:serine/threonine protein kinase
MKLTTILDQEKKLQFQVTDSGQSELGRGKEGIVYVAEQIIGTEKGRKVAMKVLSKEAINRTTPDGRNLEKAFRESLVGENGIKNRFAGCNNLVKPLHVLKMEDGGICSITEYHAGRDVGLLIDVVNDIRGIMNSSTEPEREKYDGSITPATPANFNLQKWQPIAYTIAVGILTDLISIHEAGDGKEAHKDLRPSNIVMDGFNVGSQNDKERATIESILNLDPSVIKVFLNDIDFNNPAQYSMDREDQDNGLGISFIHSYEHSNPDKRRNPLRSKENYRLRQGATCYQGTGLNIDQASDIHAAGMIIIELLTGMSPNTFKNYRDEKKNSPMSNLDALRDIKGVHMEKGIAEIVVNMLTPKKSAREYRDALISTLDKTNLVAITEDKVDTPEDKAERRDFPVIVRPYHEFMKKADKWEEELTTLERGLPQPNQLYEGLLALDYLKRFIELESTPSAITGLKKLGIVMPREIIEHKDTLEAALKKSYSFLRKEPISFTSESVNELYDQCLGAETADKVGIIERYEKIMRKYDEVSKRYTTLIDKMDEVMETSGVTAKKIASGYENTQGIATEIRSKMMEQQAYIATKLLELRDTKK